MSKAPARPEQTSGINAHRPVITGRRHVISAGHYLAAHAGFAVLEAGGNAIDAGVAAGIALGVLQSDIVNVAGVAPIVLYHAESRKVFTVSGLGVWPKLVTPDFFQKRHGGKIPRGLLRTVVPAAPDAWIQALQRWGSMSFGEVAAGLGALRQGGIRRRIPCCARPSRRIARATRSGRRTGPSICRTGARRGSARCSCRATWPTACNT